jgi:hypothetical protein
MPRRLQGIARTTGAAPIPTACSARSARLLLPSRAKPVSGKQKAFSTMNPFTARSTTLCGALAAAALNLAGCAATIDPGGVEQRTASAIGRPAGSFTITNQIEGTGGRLDYNVTTKDGAGFKCYLYSATAFQRVMSFGQTPHSDAVCSAMGAGTPAPAACNALNRAAGRC